MVPCALTVVSGYAQLTNELAELGGIDRIRDVLNPPFELIINAVHKSFGSVIKLAGDSAIVAWTIPPRLKNKALYTSAREFKEASKQARHLICGLAISCCLELLKMFENYSIKGSTHHPPITASDDTTAATASLHRQDSYFSAGFPRSGTDRASHSEAKRLITIRQPSVSHEQKLGLHIGIGIGEIHHVLVGRAFSESRGEETLDLGRAEYFIAGNALLDAGIMLNKGKCGHLVMRGDSWQLQELSFWPILKRFEDYSEKIVVTTKENDFKELKQTIADSMGSLEHFDDLNENVLCDRALNHALLRFIEPSLRKHILGSSWPSNENDFTVSNEPVLQAGKSDNSNQYRTITTLFLCIPNIPIDQIGKVHEVLEDAQFVAFEVTKIVSGHGGTCRQIFADEKGLSVLVVWGVEGFSHEKGDHLYAVAAGMDIEREFKKRTWWMEKSAGHVTSEHGEALKFSLAITMGKAQLKQWSVPSIAGKLSVEDLRLRRKPTLSSMADEDDKYEFFLALGIPRNSVRLLHKVYPLIFQNSKTTIDEQEALGNKSDAVTVLTATMISILELLPSLRLRLIFFIDDAQWMDSGSFDTTFNIIQRINNVFVIMTTRPKEEYTPQFYEYFDRLMNLPACKSLIIERLSKSDIEKLVISEMRSYGFDVWTVAPKLQTDFAEKSQGNPMAIKLLCKYLSTSADIVTKGHELRQLHEISKEGRRFELPMNALAAVTSALDKISSEAQTVLRVASVAGQFFSLEEVTFCVQQLQLCKEGSNLNNFVAQMLKLAQSHGIINPTEASQEDYSFHHYLIYQGVYESNIQSRKEEIHRLYMNFYEKKYEDTLNSACLPPLLHHLLKLPGLEEKKTQFLRLSFKTFADWGRPIEAKAYYEVLSSYEEQIPAERTVMQQAEELRLLGIIDSERRCYNEAYAKYAKAFSILGCSVSTSGFKIIPLLANILKYSSKIEKLLPKDSRQRCILGLKALSHILKAGLPKCKVDSFIRGIDSWTPPHVNAQAKHLLETMIEIRSLSMMWIGLMVNFLKPGIETVFMTLVYHISQEVISYIIDKKTALAPTSTALGLIFVGLGKVKASRLLLNNAIKLYQSMEEVEISRHSIGIYWGWGVLFSARGDYMSCIEPFQKYCEFIRRVFGSGPEVTHLARLHCLVSAIMLGQGQTLINDLQALLDGLYSDVRDTVEWADIQMAMAYNYVLLGRHAEAFEIYKVYANAIEDKVKENFPEWRFVYFGILRGHLEVLKLSNTSPLDTSSQQHITIKMLSNVKSICEALKRLNSEKSTLLPLFMLFVPTCFDIIHLVHAQPTIKTPELLLGLRTLFKTFSGATAKGAIIFPASYQVVKNLQVNLVSLGKKICTTRLMKAIHITRCTVDDSGNEEYVFLSLFWRYRVLVRIASLTKFLGRGERNEILDFLGESLHKARKCLEDCGMASEALYL
ncbi:Adenylate cyclase type 10 [Phlyctochytrium planicorne]|nr:Adenylate cyclase type 10 [Phlyctochytrium planicorne]